MSKPGGANCGSRRGHGEATINLLVLTMDRQREAAKPLGRYAELPLEPRLGEEPENNIVCATKHDVFSHARRRFRPAEPSVEGSHASDIPTGERD